MSLDAEVGNTQLGRELLQAGFAGSVRRLVVVVLFLEEQDVEQVRDLRGTDTVRAWRGADVLSDEEVLFLDMVANKLEQRAEEKVQAPPAQVPPVLRKPEDEAARIFPKERPEMGSTLKPRRAIKALGEQLAGANDAERAEWVE